MDQNMKSFDRIIEQRMNEETVPPPFGAWNRIAAQLDAMPMAAAEPAPVNNYIPKRVVASFIAGMMVMGATIAAGFMLRSSISDKTAAANNGAPAVSSFTMAQGNTSDVLRNPNTLGETSPVSKLPLYAPVTVSKRIAMAKPAAPVAETSKVVTPETKNNAETGVNSSSDVPTPVEAVTLPASKLTEPYYFPPVDIVTPEKSKEDVAITRIAKNDELAKASTDDDRPKADQKKFKPHHRRPGWAWGSINRMQ